MPPLVLKNANIYTMDSTHPKASDLAIDQGRIIAVGTTNNPLNEFPTNSKSIDLQGKTVLPGLIDAHIHLEHYAFALKKINCEVATLPECLERVRERTGEVPSNSWILGHGWNQNDWENGFPQADDLDRISTTHPIYLTAKSLHAAWANTKALSLAGINANTPDPPGGKIQRNAHGIPTGILFEGAMDLVQQVIPEPSEMSTAEAIQSAQIKLWQLGITGVHDFDRRRAFAALQYLNQEDKLKLRVIKNLPVENLDEAVEIGLKSGFGNEWLRIGSIKAFADGALGPRTAAMLQPYNGEPENRGILLLDQEQLLEIAQKAALGGFSLTVHAIGDRANHELLNAYEALRKFELQHNLPPRRHRIEHVQLLHPDDRNRLAQNHLIASMQPIHALSDMEMADKYWGERCQTAYAWRNQLDAGAVLAFGSDAPVDSPNPFLGISAAVSRRKTARQTQWFPEQTIDLYSAISAYTIGPAYTANLEFIQGRLLPGYFADLIVLPEDPFKLGADELPELLPERTMLGGQWVYSAA